MIYVNPKYQRLGIGKKLLKSLDPITHYKMEEFQNWSEVFATEISQTQIDYTELAQIVSIILIFTSPVIEGLKKLAKLLKIRQAK